MFGVRTVYRHFTIVQLMVGAVSGHLGQSGLWRRYLTIVIDGLRAHPGEQSPLPDLLAARAEAERQPPAISARAGRRTRWRITPG
jgi:hypothetical protein